MDPGRILLAGISLGAFLALASATLTGCQRVRCIVEVAGGLTEPYVTRASSTFPPTLILHGEQDTVVPISQAHALDALLTRLDIAHTTELFPKEGHWFSPVAQLRMLQAITVFLHKRL